MARSWYGRVGRYLAMGGGLVLLLALFVFVSGYSQFGRRAKGERLARMRASPEWVADGFVNPNPIVNDAEAMLRGALDISDEASPSEPPVVVRTDPVVLSKDPASGLRVTWLGHSTVLVEIDGVRVLTDPVFGERASPLSWVGPKRFYPSPLALEELPPLDAVVISHDHYDHLDAATIRRMRDLGNVFVVPLGMGAHLAYFGIAESRIVELDWWQSTRVRDVTITCTPTRHASGRTLADRDSKLWSSFAFTGPRHRVFFSGDTGLFAELADIGRRLGPFDLTMIEIGQYDPAWPDWHLGPEQAVTAHRMLRGKRMLPIHWGLFALAYHGWTEPIERALVAAHKAGVPLATPSPGETFEPEVPRVMRRWWPTVPWRTAEETPIVSHGVPAFVDPEVRMPAAPATPTTPERRDAR